MGTVQLPYLWVNHRRGRALVYYRRAGKLVRLPPLHDAAFLAAYSAAHQAAEAVAKEGVQSAASRATDAPAGSLRSLIDAYRASPEWAQLAPATRKDYDKALVPLRADARAAHAVATLPRAFVFRLRDEYATAAAPDGTTRPTPRRANRVVAVLRILLQWGVDRGWRQDNPALRPGMLHTGEGYRQWSADEVAAFLAHPKVPEPLKRAAALGYYTGQRKQDCLRLTKAARRLSPDGVREIEIIPEKTRRRTGAKLWVAEHPTLSAILDAAPASDAVTILTRADGRPWKEDNFNHRFADAVREAGLPPGTSFHGLRVALSGHLAEHGATDAEIDAVAYHADPRMTRKYRAQANQRSLARSAVAKLGAPRNAAGTLSE